MTEPSLETRFLEELRRLEIGREPLRVVVAVSGGLDSMVLLYLLRFAASALPLHLTVAHLDHAMRPESAGDALWLRGVCAAWGLPLNSARLSRAPRGETEARAARHEFLRGAAREASASRIALAHHADDQAETVLFRALRGTGLAGLAGMPALSPAGLLRPLLPFWRRELVQLATERGLEWREDATNLSLDPARNRLRLEVLPLLEREIAPGARRNLVSLARLAREAEEALEGQVDLAFPGLVEEDGEGVILARSRLLDYDSAVSSGILRKLLRRFGVVLSGTGTRRALQFIKQAPSGRELELPGGVRVRIEFDRARLERSGPTPDDEALRVEALEPGARIESPLRIGGRLYRAALWIDRWDDATGVGIDGWHTAFTLPALRFPLSVRGWTAGDRMRTAAGSKTLKKLFLERRVPRSARHRLPVLADSAGCVLWVGGIEREARALPTHGEDALFLAIMNA
jgi:tRNA(Ile)-lysidine synthase